MEAVFKMNITMTSKESAAFKMYDKLKGVCNGCDKRYANKNESCRSSCFKYRLYEESSKVRRGYINKVNNLDSITWGGLK